jgi:hypothetical protein
MKKLLPFLILIFSVSTAFAQAQAKCFRNDGLKDNHIVRFEADGGDVAGSYSVEPEGDAEKTRTFDFSGTRKGNVLTVRFAGETPSGIATPTKTKSLIWTLAQTANGEILRIKFYGKNYQTNKFADYTADFLPCEPDARALAQQAKRVSFARGENSASFRLAFKNQSERKAFRLGARKGQSISVVSPGCGISFYYPDQTAYEENRAIDAFSMDNIPQTGDYLFVISPAGEAGECATTFKITN